MKQQEQILLGTLFFLNDWKQIFLEVEEIFEETEQIFEELEQIFEGEE